MEVPKAESSTVPAGCESTTDEKNEVYRIFTIRRVRAGNALNKNSTPVKEVRCKWCFEENKNQDSQHIWFPIQDQGTSGLRSHLDSSKHKKRWQAFKTPNTLEKMLKPITPQDKADSSLLKFLIENNISFNAVDSDSFKDFYGILTASSSQSKLKPTASSKLKELLEEKYDLFQRQLLEFLSTIEFGAVTGDKWTSSSHLPFQAWVIHTLSSDWRMKNILMSARSISKSTSAMLDKDLQDILNMFDCKDKVVALVSDNASNMMAMSLAPFKEYRIAGAAEPRTKKQKADSQMVI